MMKLSSARLLELEGEDNIFLGRTAKIDPKDGVSRLNFPEGFGDLNNKTGLSHVRRIFNNGIYCNLTDYTIDYSSK